MDEKIRADELWERANNHEKLAKSKIAPSIKPFNSLFKDIYEAGILVGLLRGEGLENEVKSIDILVCGLLLKQVLTDLRVIWNLVSTGFTLQAATLAASHFEMSLALQNIMGKEENAKKFLSNNDGDLPWKIIDMCKFVTKKEQQTFISLEKPYTYAEYEMNWRALYVQYIWLCKIKHPTMQSLLHGSTSTTFKNGKYIIMSFPDITEIDLPTKTNILVSVTFRTYSVVMDFFESIKEESDKHNKNYIDFLKKVNDFPERLDVVWHNYSLNPLAVNLIGNKLYNEFILFSEMVKKEKNK